MINSGDSLTKFNEGFTPVAKPDAKGKWEYGYGFDIDPQAPGEPAPTMTLAEADAMFPQKYGIAQQCAKRDLGPLYDQLDVYRQAVVADIAYESGGSGLAGFHQMIGHLQASQWVEAALALQESKLFTQVPQRELRNIAILITGAWPSEQ